MNTREKELIRLVRDAHSNLISLLATVQPGEILHAKTHELLHEWLRAGQKELRRIESVESRAPAPQPAEGCGECHPMHNTICLCKCHDDGTSSALQPDLELLRRELRSKEDALIAMEKAAEDMLLHDGGDGSLNYDAHAYRESRRHLQSLANISCEKCGETLPHLYDENCTDYRATTPQVTPTPDIELVMALQRADEMARVIDDWTERGELNTRSALADARLNYGRPYEYKWTREGTSEQASPTPDKCPTCGSPAREYFVVAMQPTKHELAIACTDSWHSSASTQKGSK